MGQTSRITFATPPIAGSLVMICYYPGRYESFVDSFGNILYLDHQNFIYDGSSLSFTVQYEIKSVIYTEVNGLVDEEQVGFTYSGSQVTLLTAPIVGSRVGISYLR